MIGREIGRELGEEVEGDEEGEAEEGEDDVPRAPDADDPHREEQRQRRGSLGVPSPLAAAATTGIGEYRIGLGLRKDDHGGIERVGRNQGGSLLLSALLFLALFFLILF